MITGLLLTILLTFFNFLLGLLSGVAIWAGVAPAIAGFFQYVYQFNGFFPVDTAFQLLKYTADFWILIFTWEVLRFFLHLIRGN